MTKIFRRLLEFGGHSVVATGTVAEATRAAEAGAFDVLISDIGLPDGTGLDVIGQIRSHQPQLPAIALTGLGMEQDIRNSEEAGFTAHLTKPIDMALLEKTMLAVASARH